MLWVVATEPTQEVVHAHTTHRIAMLPHVPIAHRRRQATTVAVPTAVAEVAPTAVAVEAVPSVVAAAALVAPAAEEAVAGNIMRH